MSGGRLSIPAQVADGRFAIVGKLGEGSFGEVRLGEDTQTGEKVAVKFEDMFAGFLQQEAGVMRRLQQDGPQQGFARCLHSGKEAGGVNCLVMDLLGRNMFEHLTELGGKLAAKPVILVATQAVQCLEYLHSKWLVHRDVKPENFLTGRGARAHHIYLVDFGLAMEYHNGKAHHRQKQVHGFHGNFRYASTDAHRLKSQSRRSDLEALAFTLVFLATGSLPWVGVASKDWREKNARILELKESVSLEELGDLPQALALFFATVRQLGFQARPDYASYLRWFAEAREDLAESEGAPVEDHHVPWAKDEAQGCGHARELVAIRGDTVQPEEHVWSLKGYFMGSPSSPNTPTPSAMRRSRTPEPLSGRSLETFAGRVMSEGMSAALHVHTPTEMMRNLTSRFEGHFHLGHHGHHRHHLIPRMCGDKAKVSVPSTPTSVGGGHSPDTSPHFHDVEARLAYAAAMTPTTV